MAEKKVAVFAYTKVDDQVLFLLFKRKPKRGGYWQPITGKPKEDEIDLQVVACREFEEESGIQGSVIRDTGATAGFEDKGVQFEEKVYTAEITEFPTILKIAPHEHVGACWFTKHEVEGLLYYPTNRREFYVVCKLLGL